MELFKWCYCLSFFAVDFFLFFSLTCFSISIFPPAYLLSVDPLILSSTHPTLCMYATCSFNCVYKGTDPPLSFAAVCVCAQLSNIEHRWDAEGGKKKERGKIRWRESTPTHKQMKGPPLLPPPLHTSIYSSDQQSTHLAVFKYLPVLKEMV